MAITTMKAKATLKENVRVEVEARGHKVIIDEPARLGGTDQGMNPLELLLSSLGACQTIVAQMFAKQFDLQYDQLWVELEGDIDTDGFLGKSDVRPGLLELRYTIHIQSNEPKEKIEEFIRFVEAHCPAGDTIANPVRMVSSGVVIEKKQ